MIGSVSSPASVTIAHAWIRAAYPNGVPTEDARAIVAILARSLGDADFGSMIERLGAEGGPDLEAALRAASLGHAYENTPAADIARASAALAAAGWPLAAIEAEPDTGRLMRIVSWLRDGYPAGVPQRDYIPLVALLRRRLTDQEVKQVAKSLRRAGIAPAGTSDIGVEITRLTNELPSQTDIRRVHERLAKKGWPVEFPDPDGS